MIEQSRDRRQDHDRTVCTTQSAEDNALERSGCARVKEIRTTYQRSCGRDRENVMKPRNHIDLENGRGPRSLVPFSQCPLTDARRWYGWCSEDGASGRKQATRSVGRVVLSPSCRPHRPGFFGAAQGHDITGDRPKIRSRPKSSIETQGLQIEGPPLALHQEEKT